MFGTARMSGFVELYIFDLNKNSRNFGLRFKVHALGNFLLCPRL